MVGFWSVAPHSKNIRKFEDLMSLESDKIKNGSRKVSKAIVREQTPEEKAIMQSIRNGQQFLN